MINKGVFDAIGRLVTMATNKNEQIFLSSSGGNFERSQWAEWRLEKCMLQRALCEVSFTIRSRRCSCSGAKYDLDWCNLSYDFGKEDEISHIMSFRYCCAL